jgi:hypothetical protein
MPVEVSPVGEISHEDPIDVRVEARRHWSRGQLGEFLVVVRGAEIAPSLEHMQVGIGAYAAFTHGDAAWERPGLELQA